MKIPSPPRLLLILCAALPAAAALGQQARPELTEQWTPVPPLVSTPAGAAPSDAIVLFDGTNTDEWQTTDPTKPGWRIEDGAWVIVPRTGGMQTKRSFGDMQLHLEFRTPTNDTGTGQGRGNSGVMIMAGRYEVQVLDSYRNITYPNGQAASLYKQYPPLVNASRPPGEWQTYDIVFIAPRFHPDGSLKSPARLTVLHNGVLVQHDQTLLGETGFRGPPRYTAHPEKLPLQLQNHTDEVAFRNIWVRELTSPQAAGLAAMAGRIDWITLFNGHDLAGWDTWLARPAPDAEPIGLNRDPQGVFSVVEVDGRPAIRISGEQTGALSSQAPRGNYRLRLQYKWGDQQFGAGVGRPRNSGIVYHAHGQHGAFEGNHLDGVEFQLMEGAAGDAYTMGPVRLASTVRAVEGGRAYDPVGERTEFASADAPAGRRVMRRHGRENPVGEWNTIELICWDNRSAHAVNGEIVTRLQQMTLPAEEGPRTPLTAGKIQIQSQGHELFVRDIEFLPLHAEPAEFQ
jgi:hypothetical protein